MGVLLVGRERGSPLDAHRSDDCGGPAFACGERPPSSRARRECRPEPDPLEIRAPRNLADPEPPGIYTFLFGTHPPTMERIGQALAYERR